MTISQKKWPATHGKTKLMSRIIYLVAAAPCLALAVLSLSIPQPNNTVQNSTMQQAGIAANGYQKPGAAVRMFFTMPTDLQPGDSGVIQTTWLVDEPAALMELQVHSEEGLNITAPQIVSIAQPTVGFEYTLDIPFTAKAGLHTLGFVSTTHSGDRAQSRSFGIAVEAGEKLPTQRKANSVVNTPTGEKLHRMAAATQ